MARHFRPYRSRRDRDRRIILIVVAAVVVIIVAAAIFVKWQMSKEKPLVGPAPDEEILTPDEGLAEVEEMASDVIEETEPRTVVDLGDARPTLPPTVPIEPIEPQPEPATTTPPVTMEQPVADKGGTPVSNPQANALILQARDDLAAGKVIPARDKLNDVWKMDIGEVDREKIKRILSELSEKWLFSRTVYPGDTLTSLYKVQSGDFLATIGKKNNVPYELLMKINGIERPELLRAGKAIKVVHGPFHVKVSRSRFIMDLYLGKDTYVKSYRIGLGEEGKETPTGLWRVKRNGKLIRPPWPRPQELGGGLVHPDDPDYPLGSRWIGLDGIEGPAEGRTGFGIHGTKDPETIGTRSSMGCIRLYNGDVIEVYDMLMPGLSQVRVVD